MEEYISRKCLENMVDYYLSHSNGAEHYAYGIIRGEVRAIPSADVVEVKRGKWIYETAYPDSDVCNCSICDQIMQTAKGVRMNFCPNCGADMRGIKDDK